MNRIERVTAIGILAAQILTVAVGYGEIKADVASIGRRLDRIESILMHAPGGSSAPSETLSTEEK